MTDWLSERGRLRRFQVSGLHKDNHMKVARFIGMGYTEFFKDRRSSLINMFKFDVMRGEPCVYCLIRKNIAFHRKFLEYRIYVLLFEISFCVKCRLCKLKDYFFCVIMQSFLLYPCLPVFLYVNLFLWISMYIFLFVWCGNSLVLWTVFFYNTNLGSSCGL